MNIKIELHKRLKCVKVHLLKWLVLYGFVGFIKRIESFFAIVVEQLMIRNRLLLDRFGFKDFFKISSFQDTELYQMT